MRFIFDCFDSDRDGRLSEGELQQLLLTINKKLQESSYQAVEQAVDKVYQVGWGLQGRHMGCSVLALRLVQVQACRRDRGGTGAAELPAVVAGVDASKQGCSMVQHELAYYGTTAGRCGHVILCRTSAHMPDRCVACQWLNLDSCCTPSPAGVWPLRGRARPEAGGPAEGL